MEALTFVSGIGSVAAKYGLEESIFLHAIVHWAKTNKSRKENFRDGRWWTYNSVRGFTEMFPWWSEKQVRRIANSCVEQGALLTGNYNKNGRDRTIWYSPGDELLAMYGEDWSDSPICPNGQMHSPKRADASAQTGEPLPCNNPCNNIPPIIPQGGMRKRKRKEPRKAPDWKPERFEGLWAYYPEKGRKDKQAAMDAWDELQPDDALIAEIARSLERLKASPEWQDGIGIPYLCRFLRKRRWEDAASVSPPVRAPAGGHEEEFGWQ